MFWSWYSFDRTIWFLVESFERFPMKVSFSQQIRMATGFLIVSLGLALLLFGLGAFHVWQWFTNPKPVAVSMEQLDASPPPADWLTITGGAANYAGAVEIRHRGSGGSALYSPGWRFQTPAARRRSEK